MKCLPADVACHSHECTEHVTDQAKHFRVTPFRAASRDESGTPR